MKTLIVLYLYIPFDGNQKQNTTITLFTYFPIPYVFIDKGN